MEYLSIEGERLRIRNLKPSDLNNFYLYRSNPEVCQYQGFDIMTKEQAANFIQAQETKILAADEWVQYGIELRQTSQIVGDCALRLQPLDNTAEIGITISHLAQKKGYAKETLLLLLNFLFITKNVAAVVEHTDVENIASIALLQSVGFGQPKKRIDNLYFKGQQCSEFQFAMTKQEWLAKYQC